MLSTSLRTLVLDDDPTGTQSATNVAVLFSPTSSDLARALRDHPSVYVLTNTRAIDEDSAVALLRQIRRDAETASRELGVHLRIVLRGDSTLRGHVFAEVETFAAPDDLVVFVPAFPAGGRTTRNGRHLVDVDGALLPAHLTEFASDPVFGFTTSELAEYVQQRSPRPRASFGLNEVRGGQLARLLIALPPGSVATPDVENDDDIALIAEAVTSVETAGRRVIVRSGAPLAAALAGAPSTGLVRLPLTPEPSRVLLVCGSHTGAAGAQLARFERAYGPTEVISTDAALRDPVQEGRRAAHAVLSRLQTARVAAVGTERERHQDHGTLDHAELVMIALMEAVRTIAPHIDAVISKGGITGARTAADGMAAHSAWVLGQVAAGVSVWRLDGGPHAGTHQIVVPGNVGGADTLVAAVEAFGLAATVVPSVV